MTIRDSEVLELLRDDPELLAIADAVANTQPATRLRAWPARLASVAAAAAVLAALVLVAPWQRGGGPTVLERALAAVGDEPVLHAVTRREERAQWSFVDLATGNRTSPEPSVVETELWYDRARGLAHTIVRLDDQLIDDVLQTPDGVTSQGGPVYTCAWIAKHPIEATRARVSCKLSVENGTVPRNIPEPPPVVDPALGGFVTGYRDALADGTARMVGEGELNGTPVYWLELRVPVPRPPEADQDVAPFEERVAIDRETYRPLLVRPLDGQSSYSYEVVTIETVTPAEADFSDPVPLAPERRVAGQTVVSAEELEPEQASSVLGRPAFWLGPEFAGLELRKIERQELRTRYDRRAGLEPTEGLGLELTYGDPAGDRRRTNFLVAMQSTEPQMLYRWHTSRFAGRSPIPPAGVLSLIYDVGLLHRDGVYVTIWTPLNQDVDEDTIIEAARSLEVIPR